MIWSYFYLLMGLLWFLDMVYLSSSCFRATPFAKSTSSLLMPVGVTDSGCCFPKNCRDMDNELPVSPFLSSFYYNYYISLHSHIEGSAIFGSTRSFYLCLKKKPLPCWISLQETGHHPSQGVLSPSHRSPLSKLRVRDELGGSKVMIDKPPNHGW